MRYLRRSRIKMGTLRSIQPVTRDFGFELGTPIDRYYINGFIRKYSDNICGEVLEVSEDTYASKFANSDFRLTLLHIDEKKGCLQGNLETGEGIPSGKFNCIILTQTLPFIFDLEPVVNNIYKMLKKGGTLLATNPCISQISRFDMDRWGDFWRFTPLCIERLFQKKFSSNNISITSFGNVLTSTCFLQGIPAEKLSSEELDYLDEDYPVTIGLRAIK